MKGNSRSNALTTRPAGVVFHRVNEATPHGCVVGRLIPYAGELRLSARGWDRGKPVGVTYSVCAGRRLDWARLYGGHAAWAWGQIARHKQEVRRARAARAGRKLPRASGVEAAA